MKKTFLFLSLLFFIALTASSQDYNNPGGKVITCSGNFYDTGGPAANYGNGESVVTTFCSASTDSCLSISFSSFNLENGVDYLSIYDDSTITSGFIGSYTFTNTPPTIISSKGCLTFKFTSNGSITSSGWAAAISCTASCAPPVISNPGGKLSVCSGKFYDTGGLNNNYGNGENITTTLCSSTPDSCIRVTFNSFNVENGVDFLSVYDDSTTTSGLIGSYTFTNSPGTVTSSKGCLTFKFTSNGSVSAPGWAADISCTSNCATPVISNPGGKLSLCSGKFYDSGGNNNYSNGENITTTLCSSIPDSCIKVSFTSFNLENGVDFLSVYDDSTTAAGLIGSYSFTNSPGTVISSKGCLTFKFTSNGSVSAPGWAADVSCTSACAAPVISNPGGTLNLCSGFFYDSGGKNNNYGNTEAITTTLCSDVPGDNIKVAFSSFYIENGVDFLRVYDGPTTGSPLVGAYTFTNSPGTVVSSTGCLTFSFTSNGSITAPGWVAAISCVLPTDVIDYAQVDGLQLILQNNIAGNELRGEIRSDMNADFTMTVVDVQGRTVDQQKIRVQQGVTSFNIDMNGLERGLYFIRIQDAAHNLQQKFLKF